MTSSAAISFVVRPLASSRSTCASVALRPPGLTCSVGALFSARGCRHSTFSCASRTTNCRRDPTVCSAAVAEERNRLAREIHDSLAHYLTVANVRPGPRANRPRACFGSAARRRTGCRGRAPAGPAARGGGPVCGYNQRRRPAFVEAHREVAQQLAQRLRLGRGVGKAAPSQGASVEVRVLRTTRARVSSWSSNLRYAGSHPNGCRCLAAKRNCR
jgi:hypothetical protein